MLPILIKFTFPAACESEKFYFILSFRSFRCHLDWTNRARPLFLTIIFHLFIYYLNI